MERRSPNETREIVTKIILNMDKPFRISELFKQLEQVNIIDKSFVLGLLDELCDSGLVNYSEIIDDGWYYDSVFSSNNLKAV